MRYTKPALDCDQQVTLLFERGLTGDRALMVARLQSVSYYRLSGYWYPFREADPKDPTARADTFRPGTTFDEVWNRYVFDRRLRLLVMDAVERIEVAVRTWLAYHHPRECGGPFAYADDPAALPGLPPEKRERLLGEMADQLRISRETFVEHFRLKYGMDHANLPVWMAAEIMSFGSLLTFYRGCPAGVQRSVAAHLGIHDQVFSSWLLALNTIRNLCAHHGRLWNRELGTKPKIPNKDPQWHSPVEVNGD